MKIPCRTPWTPPSSGEFDPDGVLAVNLGDPWGHAVAVAHAVHDALPLAVYSPGTGQFESGPWQGRDMVDIAATLPAVVGTTTCDDPYLIAQALAPQLFGADTLDRCRALVAALIDPVYRMAAMTGQATYDAAYHELSIDMGAYNERLGSQRYLGGEQIDFADVLLFAFAVRLDSVYFDLYKANAGLLRDYEHLHGFCRDLFERPEFARTTDFDAIRAHHYANEPVLNGRDVVPIGGTPELHWPHFREENASHLGTEDIQPRAGGGEWMRPNSAHRNWIDPQGQGAYPAVAGRYHLYAPYNCPWSHRALLARAVKGLEEVVGTSIVFFRRDPEHGWQFNPEIPGCTADLAEGRDYIREIYAMAESKEKSVPLLWDTETKTVVSNESAEILRMFNDAFGELAAIDIDLYPEGYRTEIDRINGAVYQRINNGAYKAGFTQDQTAYERAFERYFAALDWLDDLLIDRLWIAGTPGMSEADLRLFPTLYRHDAIYYSRFGLNRRRVSDYRRLSDWLERMLDVPGVSEASNMDHARNGYYGRSGNELVPAGPEPLELSRRDYEDHVWLNRR